MNKTTFIAAAALATALLLPSAARAAPSTCFASLPGPSGATWSVRPDGALEHSLYVNADRAFDAAHGRLRIEASYYASVPNDPLKCDRTGNTLTFPTQTFGKFSVSRSVSSTSDGRLRHLETIKNNSAQLEFLDLDFLMEIRADQVAFTSETGNATADRHDDWFVLRDTGLFPFLQWGVDGNDDGREGATPFNGMGDENWAPNSDPADESAYLHYHADISPGETVRFLHVSGAAPGGDAAVAKARDGAGAFSGFSLATAKSVINWGKDADKDGVPAHLDECPSIKGNSANGCMTLQAQPVDPGEPADPTPPPGDPTPPPAGDPVVPPPAPAADTTAPTVTISGLSKRIRRSALARKGLRPRISCSEACSLTVRVDVRKRGSKRATRVASRTRQSLSAGPFAVRLKVAAKRTRRLAKSEAVVVIVALDAAGNETILSRRVRLR